MSTPRQSDLDGFSAWITRRGREPGTAEVYVSNVRLAFEHEDGFLGRLQDRSLSPKTRHLAMAALRSYARYSEDMKLLRELEDMKLPPARRVRPKLPLSHDVWAELREAIDDDEKLTEPMRAVLGLLAVRGFRVGDALRLTRREVQESLKSKVLNYEAKRHERIEWGIKLFKRYLEILLAESGWKTVTDLISPRSRSVKSARKNVYRAIKRVAERVGIDFTHLHPHILRRTVAVNFLEKVGDVNSMRDWMAWRSMNTAMQYVDHSQRIRHDKIEETLLD